MSTEIDENRSSFNVDKLCNFLQPDVCTEQDLKTFKQMIDDR